MRGNTSGRRKPQRIPNFDSGVLPEPRIVLGGGHSHVDPKTGISLYGPFSPPGQAGPFLSRVLVGVVGTPPMVANAEQWLKACQGILTNDGSEPFLRPHYPGFRLDGGFRCDLMFGDSLSETIKAADIDRALKETDDHQRIKNVIDLYVRAIDTLAGRDPRPHVILCCIPQNVVDSCTVGISRVRRTPKQSKALKRSKADAKAGQKSLFDDMSPRLGTEDEVPGHQNLRRGLKAETMRFGIPTQVVWPRSLQVAERPAAPGERALQDPATRAWNFTTALYHKAGASPWRLEGIDSDVCYVGVSFYREVMEANPRLRTSMAQAFTASGNGFVLRGDPFEWDDTQRGRSPHLDRKGAAMLLRNVLAVYQQQNNGRQPGRVVVHKTSLFSEEEGDGFAEACQRVPQHDFVAFGRRGVQFYRTGMYPPLRGTYIKFSDTELALYTDGYIPFLRTYPGARVPRPLEIVQHLGDSPWTTVLQEILALTKMNWNTADFSCSQPITVAFSRKVGEILAELPEGVVPRQNTGSTCDDIGQTSPRIARRLLSGNLSHTTSRFRRARPAAAMASGKCHRL